jgi:hypothetical protein
VRARLVSVISLLGAEVAVNIFMSIYPVLDFQKLAILACFHNEQSYDNVTSII